MASCNASVIPSPKPPLKERVARFLNIAFEYIGIEDWTKFVLQDEKYMRPAEVAVLCGDSTKAREKLGWEPRTSFNEMVSRMVQNDIKLIGLRMGYILPEIYQKMGLSDNIIEFTDEIIEFIVEKYTYEPGVRKLKELLFEIIGEINLDLLQNNKEEQQQIPIIVDKDMIIREKVMGWSLELMQDLIADIKSEE